MNTSEAEKLFGLREGYSLEEVRAVYKKLALRYHPDKNDNAPDATYFMQQVNEAFEILQKAAQYNQSDTQKEKAEQPKQSSSEENNNKWQQQNGYWAQQDDRERKESAREEQERRRTAQQQREQDERKRAERVKEEQRRSQAAREARKHRELEQAYLKACAKSQSARTPFDHNQVAQLFKNLGDYKDSATFVQYHENKSSEMSAALQEEYARETKYRIISFIPFAVPLLMLAILFFQSGGVLASIVPVGLTPLPMVLAFYGAQKEGRGRLKDNVFLDVAVLIIPLVMILSFAYSWLDTSLEVIVLFATSLLFATIGCKTYPEGKARTGLKLALGMAALVLSCIAMYKFYLPY